MVIKFRFRFRIMKIHIKIKLNTQSKSHVNNKKQKRFLYCMSRRVFWKIIIFFKNRSRS